MGRVRPFVRLLVVSLFLGALLPVSPPGFADTEQGAAAWLPTPALIERDVEAGLIDRATADRYLAYAFGPWEMLPERYRSDVLWEGTTILLELHQRVARMPRGAARSSIERALTPAGGSVTCDVESGSPTSTVTTSHFLVDVIVPVVTGNGITGIGDYTTALENVWSVEVDDFGWKRPPEGTGTQAVPGSQVYAVMITELVPGLGGFVAPTGTYAELIGNNPFTSWDDTDAFATCMALSNDFTTSGPTPPEALQRIAAHEWNHSIQFGYGALSLDGKHADTLFAEAGATWMESQAYPSNMGNQYFLWPFFTDDMGDYTDSIALPGYGPYSYWVVLQGLAERFGPDGAVGGAEDMWQDFWELTSQEVKYNLTALNQAIINAGLPGGLAAGYHDTAIALGFLKDCGGGYALPHCFAEASDYIAGASTNAIQLDPHGDIPAVGGMVSGSIPDNYSLNWIELPGASPSPAGAGAYNLKLTNTSAGGLFRASVACDTGAGIDVVAFPGSVPAGGVVTLGGYDPSVQGCTGTPLAIVTNIKQTGANPTSSTARSYTLTTFSGAVPKCPAPLDTLLGNHVIGTAAAETLVGSTGVDVMCGMGGNDVLKGDAGNDRIDGAGGNDTLDGGSGNDTMTGAAGNDILKPGTGNDPSVSGGPGVDTLSYPVTPAVTVSLASGTATGQGSDTLSGLEKVLGTPGADTITGNSGANTLSGLGGNDVLKGLAGVDVLLGGKGNDNLNGGLANDTLNGGPGVDVCASGGGSDTFISC